MDVQWTLLHGDLLALERACLPFSETVCDRFKFVVDTRRYEFADLRGAPRQPLAPRDVFCLPSSHRALCYTHVTLACLELEPIDLPSMTWRNRRICKALQRSVLQLEPELRRIEFAQFCSGCTRRPLSLELVARPDEPSPAFRCLCAGFAEALAMLTVPLGCGPCSARPPWLTANGDPSALGLVC